MQASIKQKLCISHTNRHLKVLWNPDIPHLGAGGGGGDDFIFGEDGEGWCEGIQGWGKVNLISFAT